MIVIVDTNMARNENSFSLLLGNRSQLESISSRARLLIPEVVVDEIVAQKRMAFQKELALLKRSGVLKLIGSPDIDFSSIAFDDIEHEIRNDQSIEYGILPLPPADFALPMIYRWAMAHSAPFEEKNDKGFKDACIVASIEYYLQQTKPKEPVVLCTDDNRMLSYFKGRNDILAINDLGKAVESEPRATALPEHVDTGTCEAGTSASVTASSEISSLITELRNSTSFQATHGIIKKLNNHRQSFSVSQELEILDAAISNQQVSWILKDDDVCDFIKPIFLRHKDDLVDSDYRLYIDRFDLSDEREEERGEPYFTASEKRVFSALVDAIESHVVSKEIDATIKCEPNSLLNGLKTVLDSHRVDDNLSSIDQIMNVLIDGHVETKPGAVPVAVISNFVELLKKSSPRKAEAISLNLMAHLRDIEDEIPF